MVESLQAFYFVNMGIISIMFEDVNVWFLRAVEGTANVSIKLDIPSPVSFGSTKKYMV